MEFYRDLAVETGGPVLEPGCGSGRTLFPVAAAGPAATGLEISPEMLAAARGRAAALPPEVASRITLLRGDMRDPPELPGPFRLISLPYRTFQHLLTPADQFAALAGFHDLLEPGGRLALNQFDPSLDLEAVVLRGPPAETPVDRLPVDTEFTDGEGRTVRVRYRREYDLVEQLLRQELHFQTLDAGGGVAGSERGELVLRYTFRYEMEWLLEAAGFRPVALWGGFDGRPYPGHGEQVWVAEAV